MKDFNQLEQDQIRSMIPEKVKKSAGRNMTVNLKGIIKMRSRTWVMIGLSVLMIIIIIALRITYNKLKTQYSTLLSQEYDFGKNIFIAQYRHRGLSNEVYNLRFEVTHLSGDYSALESQVKAMREEVGDKKKEIEELENKHKIALQEYIERQSLMNQLKEQNNYYESLIMAFSANPS